MKKIYFFISLLFLSIIFFAFRSTKNSYTPPSSYSGANGYTCNSCHSGSLNNGGSVTVTGLPTNYTAGESYPISVTINTSQPNIKRFGFEMEVRSAAANVGVGTFSTTNGSVNLYSDYEISHLSAPIFSTVQTSYTFDNIVWTAPSTPGSDDVSVNFFVAGMAANGTGSNGGDFVYTATRNTTLPVQLNYINIVATTDDKVQLNWQTAQEVNNKNFDIERSTNGVAFEKIGLVNGLINSTVLKNYTFTDNTPPFLDKKIYYRLKQIDINGAFQYSKILSIIIRNKQIFTVQVYPTPLVYSNNLTVQIAAIEASKATLTLYNTVGLKVFTKNINLLNGNNYYTLNSSEIPYSKGLYTLVINNGSTTKQLPVMIQ